jgi:hypothetical protein
MRNMELKPFHIGEHVENTPTSFYEKHKENSLMQLINNIDLDSVEIKPLFVKTPIGDFGAKVEFFTNTKDGEKYLPLDARCLQVYLENPDLIPDTWRVLGNEYKQPYILFEGSRFQQVFRRTHWTGRYKYNHCLPPVIPALTMSDGPWRFGFCTGLGECYTAVIPKPQG